MEPERPTAPDAIDRKRSLVGEGRRLPSPVGHRVRPCRRASACRAERMLGTAEVA